MKNQEKLKMLLDGIDVGDVGDTNAGFLSFGEVEALGYFQLLNMRFVDSNVVTGRLSTTVPQLYLI